MNLPSCKRHNKKKNNLINFRRNGREMAMQFLYQYDLSNKEFNEQELSMFWQRIENNDPGLVDRKFKKSREFAEKIIHGVIDNWDSIDKDITKFSEKWDIHRMGVIDRNIIRIAVYEMYFCDDVPPIVSINEAIDIGKDFSTEKSGTFINGILNGVKDTLTRPAREAIRKS